MKRIIIITVLLVLALLFFHAEFVEAQRFVDQDVFAATLHPTDGLVTTSIPIDDVQVLGYVCTSFGCEDVGDVIMQTSTGQDNRVTLTYPTTLQNPFGYGLFFYKPGYITWEVRSDWYGTNPSDPAGPFDAYLSRAEGCRAPIDTFTVVDRASPNQPIVIEVETELSATTRSALFNSGPIEYIPPALISYYQVATDVVLTIVNDQGQVVHTATRPLTIDFDGQERTSFTYTPTEPGRYTARVESQVVDTKCSSQFSEFSEKDFSVFADAPTNTCVALLNDLNGLPVKQKVGDTVAITLNAQADSYNGFGVANPEATELNVIITYEGDTVFQDQIYVPAASQAQTSQEVSLDWVPQDAGEHKITVTSDMYCPYATETNDEVSQSYFVVGSDAPTLSPIADQILLKNSGFNNDLENLGAKVFDPDSTELTLSIASQSNTNVVSCSIDANEYLDCTVQPNIIGESQVTVQVTDGTSFDAQTFTVFVTAGDAPTLSIPDQTLDANSGFNDNVVDLFAYVDDDQDLDSELDFLITQETATNIVDCSLQSNRFIDCTVQPDVVGFSDVTVRVTDTLGNSVEDTFRVIVDGDIFIPQCRDGVDNDKDGLVDLYDPGCVNPDDNDESDDPIIPQCRDGIDNDGDGKTDLADPGCANADDNDESDDPIIPQCRDGIDNDKDGRTDFPEDTGCTSPDDDEELGVFTCTDSDNGFVSGTKGTVRLFEGGVEIESQVDRCVDSDYLLEATCSLPSGRIFIVQNEIRCQYGCFQGACLPKPADAQCQDGIDNDNDGLIDFPADPGCSSPSDDDEYNFVPTPKQCEDGVDNDNDGLVDFPADPGCSSPSDDDEYNFIPTPKQCEDGIDNDNDGLVDFPADPGCSSPSDNDEYNFVPTPKQCEDGIDNDNDGFVDLFDPGCSSSDDDDESDDPVQPKAQLQIIHSAADPGLSLVDIYVNDVRAFNDVAYLTATPFFEIDANTRLDIDITSATALDNNNPVFETSVTLQENEAYVVVATGVANDLAFVPNPDGRNIDFELIVVDDAQTSGQTTNNVDYVLVQTATDLTRYDLITRSLNTLASNVVYGDVEDYESILASSYVIDLVDDANETLIRSFNANAMSTLGGDSIVLLTTGFVNKTLNQNGPTLKLVGVLPTGEVIEFGPLTQCQDGIDNDRDGLTDLLDPGCASPGDDDEFDFTPVCSDGIDNDGDGKIDLADPGCSGPNDEDESDDPVINQCEDGIDNDGDGLIDFPADPGCSSFNDNNEFNAPAPKQCADGIDNDNDGLVDLFDPGCSSSTDDDESDDPVINQCEDGIDNDGDGLIDFPADPGCSSSNDNDEYNAPADNGVSALLIVDPSSGTDMYSGIATCTANGLDAPLTVSLQVDGVTIASQSTSASTVTINQPIDIVQPGSYVVSCTVVDNDLDVDVDSQVIVVDQSFVSECKDGIDNDGDGEIDEDDPACERGMQKESDDPAVDEGLFVSGIQVVESYPEYIDLGVGVRNLGTRDVDNVKIAVSIPQFGIYGSVGPFDLDGGDRENKRLILPLYQPLPQGEHLVRVSISSEGDHRIKHRWIWVE